MPKLNMYDIINTERELVMLEYLIWKGRGRWVTHSHSH